MIRIDNETIDKWFENYDHFKYDFKRYLFIYCKALGIYPVFDDNILKVVHDNWAATIEYWAVALVANGTTKLSHLKILSVLLAQLVKLAWIRELRPFDIQSENLDYHFSGSLSEFDEVRADIVNGREAYLGLDFILNVINAFEAGRLDKETPFTFRLTEDLRHDIMIYLRSDTVDPIALFLIIKAMYTRD